MIDDDTRFFVWVFGAIMAGFLLLLALLLYSPLSRQVDLDRCRQQEPAPPAALCARVDSLGMA